MFKVVGGIGGGGGVNGVCIHWPRLCLVILVFVYLFLLPKVLTEF